MPINSFCSHCGTKFAAGGAYPLTCSGCGVQTWANPIPVAVVLVPVILAARTGLLVVRRAIPPVGKLALIGGFVEDHESWQHGAARELHEEANVTILPETLEPLWYASSEPVPNRVLLFSLAPAVASAALPAFTASSEASHRGIIFGPDGLEAAFAFPLHVEAVRRYFRQHHVTGPLAFTER